MRFRIDLKIFIFLIVFYFTSQLSIYLWTMLFCFIHEIGHLIMGIILGLKPEKIEMTPFGFSLEFNPITHKNKKEILKTNILVAIAGPVTNLIIIFVILLLHISFIGRDLAVYSNLIIFAFNLIPIYPLDGGRVLNYILNWVYDDIRAENLINKISNFYIILITMIGSIAIYYLKNIAILIILGYLWYLVIKENKRFLLKKKTWEFTKKNMIS